MQRDDMPGGSYRQDYGMPGTMSDQPDIGRQAQDKASELADRAREQAEAGREQAAGGMHQAARKVRESTSGKGGMQEQIGGKAADQMERASGYLREHNTSEIMDDMERYDREHPMQAVAGAVAAGFVIGRILR